MFLACVLVWVEVVRKDCVFAGRLDLRKRVVFASTIEFLVYGSTELASFLLRNNRICFDSLSILEFSCHYL